MAMKHTQIWETIGSHRWAQLCLDPFRAPKRPLSANGCYRL